MNMRFHCGDIVQVTNLEYYIPEVRFLINVDLVIVGIHPITIKGTVSYKAEEIQYICVTPDYFYVSVRGDTIESVGHIDYRSIFGKFTLNQLSDMLKNPKNVVEQYHFKKLQCLCDIKDRNMICFTGDSELVIKSSISGNKSDYFTNDKISVTPVYK